MNRLHSRVKALEKKMGERNDVPITLIDWENGTFEGTDGKIYTQKEVNEFCQGEKRPLVIRRDTWIPDD